MPNARQSGAASPIATRIYPRLIYPRLIRHFFSRFFDTESLSPQGEAEAGVIQTLGILAAPGAFFVLLFRPLTLTGSVAWCRCASRLSGGDPVGESGR